METNAAALRSLLLVLLLAPASALAGGPAEAVRTTAAASVRAPRALDFAKVCELSKVDRSTTRSESCLGCHDGTTAPAVEHRSLGAGTSHPVGIKFDVAWARRSSKLHAKAALPAKLALPNGEVACTTCHDGASAQPKKVAVTMNGSQLCLSCHNL